MRKKVYGSYQVAACPFCGDRAYAKNKQGVAVCANHKNTEYADMKCMCGEYVEIKSGKFGAFFLCASCGPVNQNKIINVNDGAKKKESRQDQYATKKPVSLTKTETIVRSDDPNYFS